MEITECDLSVLAAVRNVCLLNERNGDKIPIPFSNKSLCYLISAVS